MDTKTIKNLVENELLKYCDEVYYQYHHFTSLKQKIRTNISKNGIIVSPKTNQGRKCLHGKIIPKIRSN